jgi:nucleotide-binding universal stress UspA family protein
MFRKILLPLDGSEIAEMAIPYAEELGKKVDSEVVLFHVCGSEHQQYRHMHQIYLEKLAETVSGNMKANGNVTTKLEVGEPSQNICRFVDDNDIGLIVMTTTGYSGLKVAMLGSIADRVCRTVRVPVLFVRPQDAARTEGKKRLINRILLSLDGSDVSKLALSVAEDLAAKLKASLALFQMARAIYPYAAIDYASGIPLIDYDKLSRDEEKRVRAEMISLEKELREKGLTVTHSVTSGTDAANQIIEAGKKVDADLMIMSTHGRSNVGRWVFGSVAEKVLRHGETPLLLVNVRTD